MQEQLGSWARGRVIQNVVWVAGQGAGSTEAGALMAQELGRPSLGLTDLHSPRKPFSGEPPELPLRRGL